jgi:hypothetical protein
VSILDLRIPLKPTAVSGRLKLRVTTYSAQHIKIWNLYIYVWLFYIMPGPFFIAPGSCGLSLWNPQDCMVLGPLSNSKSYQSQLSLGEHISWKCAFSNLSAVLLLPTM